MNGQGIDIGSILNKLDDMVDENSAAVKTYGLRYLKKRDTNNQVIGEIQNARKGVKNPKAEFSGAKSKKGKFRYNLKSKGTILLYDEDAKEYRSVKVACIYQFRDFGSNKWLDRI